MTVHPQPADYLQQAASNVGLAMYLRKEKPEYLDWATTCLFYSALHYVNAFLASKKTAIPRRHRASDSGQPGRLNIVQQDPTLQEIYPQYRHLDDESRDARYELRRPKPHEFDAELVPKLREIQEYILPKITT